MNRTLFTTFIRERMTSPIRILLVALFAIIPVVVATFFPAQARLPGGDDGMIFVWILGAGVIGMNVSSGVLQLLFARPVTRREYVLSRWLALGLISFALQAAITLLLFGILAGYGSMPAIGDLANALASQFFATVGMAAVIIFFSSLGPSVTDLGLLLGIFLMSQILNLIANAKEWGWLIRACKEIEGFLMPQLDLAESFGGGHHLLGPSVAWFSTVAICLALAIVVMNRKELSYAAG